MKIFKLLLFVFFFSSIGLCLEAQINEDIVRQELEDRGISEEDVRERLLERGIDIDNIDMTDPQAVLQMEQVIKEVLEELEAEADQRFLDESTEINKVDQSDTLKIEEEPIDDAQESKKDQTESEEAESEEEPGIYGHDIFQKESLKLFQQEDNIKPSDAYILGIGDEIGISIWGYSQESQVYEIDGSGFINPYKMEPIYLKGLTYGEAKNLLERRFNQYYRFRPNEFRATLAYSRDLTVNIVGEVKQAGSYLISAQNTAFNALMAADGPNDIGSVRTIKLLKAGQEPKILDVYKYLLDPTITDDFYLEQNDIILVPVAERIVTLEGAVIRAGKYELVDGEELVDLFEIAGGFRANAILQNIQVKRFDNDQETIIDVNFNKLLDENTNFDLLNGDVVIVNEIPNTFENYVELVGAVNLPGKYSIEENTRITDILNRVEILPDALSEIAYIKRFNPDNKSARYLFFNINDVLSGASTDNHVLQSRDQIVVYQRSRFADEQKFVIAGAVRSPGVYQIDNSESVKFSEAIFLAGGLRQDASEFAYIKRKRFSNRNQIEYIRVDLNIIDQSPENDITLKNGDDIIIYSTINDEEEVHVLIDGAVKKPGKFVYDESLRLKDILSMAGGFKIEAAPYKVDVYRLVFDDKKKARTLAAHLSLNDEFELDEDELFALQPFDQIYVREAPEFEFHKTVNIIGEVKYKGKYPVLRDNEKITDIINRAGGLTDEAFEKGTTLYRKRDSLGYIVIDLEEAMKNPNSHFNLIVQDGDILEIPKTSNIVTITGETKAKDLASEEVSNNGNIHAPYQKGKNADYYIERYAGGIGEDGNSSLVTVTFPTGDVKTTSRFLFFIKYPEVRPGSTIRIGSKRIKEKQNENKSETDWGKVLTDSVAQATAILSLVLLVQRID